MKQIIYRPKGRALEYSPLALNHYLGCDHECTYCYNRFRWPIDDARIRKIDIDVLRSEITENNYTDQILLSFIGDPYCHAEMSSYWTRDILKLLFSKMMKVAVLTKGGTRCLRDLWLFDRHKHQVKVGATLSFISDDVAAVHEPNSAPPSERIAALRALHESGIRTWVSVEPVLDTMEALIAIKAVAPYVDEFRIGKLNHDKELEAKIDWQDFLERVVSILEPHKDYRVVYIKTDLREAAPDVDLPPGWDDMRIGWL